MANPNNEKPFDEIKMLLADVDARNKALDDKVRQEIRDKRSLEKAIDAERNRLAVEATLFGSYNAAAAFDRELRRTEALKKDSDRRKRDRNKDFEYFFLGKDDAD
jgi:hypothetical protein